jgi:DNA-binding transcriptional LysR family regulator
MRRVLDLMSDAVEHFRAPALSGHVRLGLSEDFASAGLTAALVSFRRRNPEVELTIEIGMSGDLFRQLDEGRYDLVFAKRLHGSCRGSVVRSEPLMWCVGSQVSGIESYDVVPLVQHPEPSVTRLRVLQTLEATGRPYRVVVSSGSLAALKAAVMAGRREQGSCGTCGIINLFLKRISSTFIWAGCVAKWTGKMSRL